MAISRKQLRDGISDIVTAALPGVFVSTNRVEDIRELDAAVLITIESADIEYYLDGTEVVSCALNVRYGLKNGTDDELDAEADLIREEIRTGSPALLEARAAVLEQIVYEDFGNSINTITLSYQVTL